ncbi:ABC transporter substrate binding protein [Skermanella rosea]|uniref:ABC transporter substrate binding protein n=1 Tax=Skermanella rosea TaxID=1817965 RepID=UPI0019333035|nr:ABC transporter substrate binding protein [Skermanella rosea]
MDQPGTNVTGVINGVPIPDQLDAFSRLGKLKSLVVLFNPKEPNSNLIADQIVDWGRNHGVEVIRRRAAATGNSLEEVMEEIRSGRLKADALYSGADSYIASKAADIQAAIGDRIRLFGGTQTFILRGWLAAYSPPVKDMGKAAADLTADILKGADPRTTPVVLPQPRLMISSAAAAAHGIAPPDDALLEK